MNKYNKETLQEITAKSYSLSEVFRNLGLQSEGANFKWMRDLLQKNGISTDHFKSQCEYFDKALPRDLNCNDISNGTRLKASVLRKFLLIHGVNEECNQCKLIEWNGIKIILDIDHINGICTDSHINNLQFLCPNCHRHKTIKEHAEKRALRKIARERRCSCGNLMYKKSKQCLKCSSHRKKGPRIKHWPADEELRSLVWEYPLLQLKTILGISDNTIRKHCKSYSIPYPTSTCGFWQAMRKGNFEEARAIRQKIENQFENYSVNTILP